MRWTRTSREKAVLTEDGHGVDEKEGDIKNTTEGQHDALRSRARNIGRKPMKGWWCKRLHQYWQQT